MNHIIQQFKEEIFAHYYYLHKHPELSFKELSTAQYVYDVLHGYGLEVYRLPSNAVLGLLRGKMSGKTVGVRAELDALPLLENTSVEYKSQNTGVMHACGHDLHMACSLGAAKVLSLMTEKLNGNVLFVFQHAEEKIPGGAQDVIFSDVFKQMKPDAMLALHSFSDLKAGDVGFREGPYMASGDEIDILVKGLGGHAAMPHTTVDTVLVAAQIVVALQQITSRFVPAHIPSVLTFGNVEANSVMNIIPKLVKLEGTFRIMNEEWRSKALAAITKIAKNIAEASGAQCEVVIRSGYPAIANNEELTAIAREAVSDLLGAEHIEHLPLRMTTDDFGYYAQNIPSVYYRIGVADRSGVCSGLHTPEFLPNVDAIETGVQSLCSIISRFLDK